MKGKSVFQLTPDELVEAYANGDPDVMELAQAEFDADNNVDGGTDGKENQDKGQVNPKEKQDA